MNVTNCHAHLILPHATDLRALLVPAADAALDGDRDIYALPALTPDGEHRWQDVAHLNRAARSKWRADVTVRRCVHTRLDSVGTNGDRRRVSVYELENHSPSWAAPDGARWVASADEVDLASPEQRVWLGDWFRRQQKPVPPTRREWYRAGWWDGFLPAIREKLDQLGLRPTGDFEQVRTWERSALLRVATGEGTVWVKAVPPMFAHEAALAGAFAARFPWHAPDVLAVDPGRKWIVMREFGRTLDQVPDPAVWVAALGAFGRFQVNLADQVPALRAAGVPDRPIAGLADDLASLLEELTRCPGRMLPAEVARLVDGLPAVRAAAGVVADLGLPDSLEHGDFWPGQVVVEGDLRTDLDADDDGADEGRGAARDRAEAARFRFIDWSDAAVTCPLLSVLFFADPAEVGACFPSMSPGDAAELSEQLAAAYLAPFGRFAPVGRIRDAMPAVRVLAPAHHAVTYARHVLPHMEAQWEMRPTVDAYLRKLLAALDAA